MYVCAKNFVQEESGKCGVNLKGIKVNYVIRQILKSLFFLIFILGCMVGTYFLNQRFLKIIKQRILESEVARAESTFYSMALILWQCVCWYYGGIWMLDAYGKSFKLLTLPLVLLVVLGILCLGLRKLNIGLPVCERWGYQGKLQKKWLDGMQMEILFGYPLISFVTAMLMVASPSLAAVIWMILGDVCLFIDAFVMPDLLASVDGVDSVDDIAKASIVD